jgi:GNAT superfamily N-acetyltransferase
MIRKATAYDAIAIAAFYADIRMDSVPPIHSVGDIEWYITHRLIARGSSHAYELDGNIVGWLDTHKGWVDQLYCRRGFTGRGVGKALLDFAKQNSLGELQLWTFQVNTGARKFYAREGFIEVELTDGKTNEERAPDVRMKWKR